MDKEINELNTLIKVISKNKVKQVQVIGDGSFKGSKIQELYDGISNGVIKSDIEAKNLFFDLGPNKDYYFSRLKRKLKKRLINTLFFIDINQPNFTEIQRAYYTCYKEASAVKILLGRFAREPAIKLAKKVIKTAMKYDFTEIVLELARTLRIHYANILGNKKKLKYYNQIIEKYLIIYQYEIKAEELYSNLIINFVNSRSTKPELKSKAKLYYNELRGKVKTHSSYKLDLNSYLLFILYFELQNDFKNTLIVCNEAIARFELRPHIVSKTVMANFLFRKLICQIILSKFEEGEDTALRCLDLEPQGSINWFLALDYYIRLLLYSKQLNKAYGIFQIGINHQNIEKQYRGYSEHWKIHNAFFHYLIQIGKIEKENIKKGKNFRLSKFLNEVPTYSKDKRGVNIPIIILQILFLLEKNKFGEIIDKTESLKTYTHRYLRRNDTFRSNCFIKMLLCLPAASFHKSGVIRKAKKYKDLLKSVPIQEANQSPEIEIIPYEMLWEFILESLDHKFH